MPNEIKIRKARRTDRESLAALLSELGYPEAADANTLFWVLNHPEIDVIVATDALDRAVGMVSISHRPQLGLRGRLATIEELVVSRPLRGKGIGTRLIKAAVDRAKALSSKRVEMTVVRRLEAGTGELFRNSGFVQVERDVLWLEELERGR